MNRYVLIGHPETDDIVLKTRNEISCLKRSGSMVARILGEVARYVRPGIRTGTLEKVCERRVQHYGRKIGIEKFEDFPTFLSISVNEVAVHGLPNDTVLRSGDIVTLDLVLLVEGWYGDHAVTVPVGPIAPELGRLINAARKATAAGIACARAGARIGDIGAAISGIAKRYETEVFENFVGHGIGKILHEGPVGFMKGEKNVGEPIVPGMVFTIEPVLTLGKPSYVPMKDGYSLKTADSGCTAMFEHMVAVLPDKTVVLTESI